MTDEERQADQEDRDQADRQDLADIEDQADQDQDGKGDRGRRGVQGLRGRPGLDSDSIEVLTEVLDKLAAELVGLGEYVRAEGRGRRLSMAVIAVAFTLAAIVGGLGYANYRSLSERQALDRQQNAVEIRANKFDQQAGLNDACLRDNVNRASRRRLFLGLYDLVASTTPATPRTPAEQTVLDDFLTEARGDVVAETAPIDCATVVPPPEGERPS